MMIKTADLTPRQKKITIILLASILIYLFQMAWTMFFSFRFDARLFPSAAPEKC